MDVRRELQGHGDVTPADEVGFETVDAATSMWRQGDCCTGNHSFVYRFHTPTPITEHSATVVEQTGGEVDLVEDDVVGFMVASQTCDVVRESRSRPFIKVHPLVEVELNFLEDVRKGRRPGYAYIAGVADLRLVADLDRVMTVEKSVVASWDRIPGCATDDDARKLAFALGRNITRTAFPDDFTRFAQQLQRRIRDKHNRGTAEGEALRSLREIRVSAKPSWSAEQVEIEFYFIRDEQAPVLQADAWEGHLAAWLELVPADGRFVAVSGLVVPLSRLTAEDYVESSPLDLDNLSQSNL